MGMGWLFGRRNAMRVPVLVSLAILIAAVAARYPDPEELRRLRDSTFDIFQRLKPREYAADLPVRIVDIDEKSLAELGQWPWPRTLIAKLLDKLAEKGAAVVAFDILFSEPDRTSLGRIAAELPDGAGKQELAKIAATMPDNDRVLAESIAKVPVVLGYGFDYKAGSKPPRKFHGNAINAGEGHQQQNVFAYLKAVIEQQPASVKSLEVLEAAAKGNGSINPDITGGIVRRVPMVFQVANAAQPDDLFMALSIETVRVVQEAKAYVVRMSGAQKASSFGGGWTGVDSIKVGELEVKTDYRGLMNLYDSGHREERYVAVADVLKDKVPAEKLEAHIVFIGTSASGLQDIRATPLVGAVPGVEVHAQLVEQMLTKTYLERPDYSAGLEIIYLIVVGLLFIVLLPRLSAGRMAIVAVVLIAAGVAVPWYMFSQHLLLFDPVYPPVVLAAIYSSGSALAFMRTEQERSEIRGAFGLYLSPDVVEQVARNPELLQLGGQLREITVMFTDVRGFTTISEQFDPQGLTKFMNGFLSPMTDVILSKRGTVDKYMGDAIMAFWNAPLDIERHAASACDAALEMQRRLRELNITWKQEAEAENRKYIPVNFGIGLNTGHASVGNFGSAQRFTYSALSDAVNLASRLEGQCKTYAVGIILGNKTQIQVPELATVELDLITVKGKTEPERMFCLVGDAEVAKSDPFARLQEAHAAFLGPYRAGDFAAAKAAVAAAEAAATAIGWTQGYYAMMAERIDELIADPPENWNGVYVAKEK
jgi:adenylate cyclase